MSDDGLIGAGDLLFSKRATLLSMWQTVADEFYPERADFTASRTIGTEFADHLTTSYPLLVRRDLGNSFGAMMRPTSIDWFNMRAQREELEDHAAKEWMERAGNIMRRAMYDRSSLFTRASKEADHDIATFGNAVKTVELNRNADGLLYRCWHLRDVAWCENAEGKIGTVHRKWRPTAQDLVSLFGAAKLHTNVTRKLDPPRTAAYDDIQVRHIVMSSEEYHDKKFERWPYVSIYIDIENKHTIEAVGQSYFKYIIPRWQTVSGSQYAFSPATIAALPDARLLQAMTRTLLEAGEKATNPPMVAVQDAIRSDISIYAGGVTWVDAAYDERLGEVLRPITQDRSGMPMGMEMHDRIAAALNEAFFRNALSALPPAGSPEMTAYEVGQRVQEYIRQASPIFEPLEDEDNGATCETTFELMMSIGAFGPREDIPQSIRGADIGFRFESPLHEAIERQKATKFMEVRAVLAEALALDASVAAEVDIKAAFRDVITGIGTPQKWLRSEEDAAAIIEEQQAEQETAKLIEAMGAGADVAKTIGEAGQALGPEMMAA